jgi:ribonuclease J
MLRGRLDDIVGIVLTHGHEDHIGAVPYLLRERGNIPLIGSKLTLAFIDSKLKEHRIKNTPTWEVEEGDIEELGPFECEFVAVNHSIPDALAVAIRTPAGTVLHTGDFKMDQLPLDGRITDLRAFARIGEEGVDLFLTDSTNADVPGFTTTERSITPALEAAFARSTQRIIVASFASHVHRVQQVMDTAVKYGRKVAFVGRSMVRNMGIAQDLGYLNVPPGVMVDIKQVGNLPPSKVVLMSTGSQGEPMAALSRMANNDHHIVTLREGDTVVLASSLIPGNENAIYRVINGLVRTGAHVIHKGNALVHVSGHASAGELLYCYNIVRPKNVMPVHGELRHLHANAELARLTGIPDERVHVVEDGYVVDLADGVAQVTGRVECGYVFVDGASVGDLTESELKDRRILGEEGFVSVIVVIDSASGKLVSGPEITARGVAEDEKVFEQVRPQLRDALETALRDGVTDTYNLQQVIRRTVGGFVSGKLRRKPMIIPTVLDA